MVAPINSGEGWTGADPESWRLPPEEAGGAPAPPRRPRHRPDPSARRSPGREARVLGGTYASSQPPSVWDKEPLRTVKRAPRLFAWGVPTILALSFAVAFGFRAVNISNALLGALVLCAVGFAVLFGLAQRRQTDPLKKHLPGSDRRVM